MQRAIMREWQTYRDAERHTHVGEDAGERFEGSDVPTLACHKKKLRQSAALRNCWISPRSSADVLCTEPCSSPMCAKAASKQVPYDATAGGGSTGSRLPKSAGNQRLSICNSGPT